MGQKKIIDKTYNIIKVKYLCPTCNVYVDSKESHAKKNRIGNIKQYHYECEPKK